MGKKMQVPLLLSTVLFILENGTADKKAANLSMRTSNLTILKALATCLIHQSTASFIQQSFSCRRRVSHQTSVFFHSSSDSSRTMFFFLMYISKLSDVHKMIASSIRRGYLLLVGIHCTIAMRIYVIPQFSDRD